jgi:hypothetical protein
MLLSEIFKSLKLGYRPAASSSGVARRYRQTVSGIIIFQVVNLDGRCRAPSETAETRKHIPLTLNPNP